VKKLRNSRKNTENKQIEKKFRDTEILSIVKKK